jgi:carbon-monoxide dehydrogenase small subunit
MASITLTVNGQEKTISTPPDRPLLEVLREDLQLTGAHYGCGEGQCGACTVLVDGKRTFSCKTPVSKVSGKTVQTIEGLAQHDQLHPIQQAFLEESAFQCAYCTSGMIMATLALLNENPKPTDPEIKAWMNKNLCRCCSSTTILTAVKRAAGREQEVK